MAFDKYKIETDDLYAVTGGMGNDKSDEEGKRVSCKHCSNIFKVPYGTTKAKCTECGKTIDV